MSEQALTIFEKRFEDWSDRHPRRWIPTTDYDTAAQFISTQTKQIVSAQIETADRIIVSQERIASGVDKVAVGVDRISDGLEGLASTFEWGFSEMVWHLEQNGTLLKKILKVLQAPLDTQAKELRKRAENAYGNGWIDDALDDFLESEKKNRYDFTIHQSLGNIYFFHKKNPEKALEYYEKAVKYATPNSPYHASLGLLHIGLIRYLQADFPKAYEAASKAIELSPKLYEAHYDCARYCASLCKFDEALDHLWDAIEGDRNYCLKANSEKDFDVMKEQVQSSFKESLCRSQKKAKEETDKAQELIQYAESHGLSDSGECEKFVKAKKIQTEAEEFLKRASLFDCEEAYYKAGGAQLSALDALESYISEQISSIAGEYEGERVKLKEKSEKWPFIPGVLIGCAVFLKIVVHAFINAEHSGVFDIIFSIFVAVPIGFVILGAIGGAIFWPIGWLIFAPVRGFLTKRLEVRYGSRLAELQNRISEVKNKRSELNWEYKQPEEPSS